MTRLFALSSFVFFALTCPAVAATTVRVEQSTLPLPLDTPPPAVVITDETGEANSLQISYTFDPNEDDPIASGRAVVTVRDAAATLEAGDGCTSEPDGRVRCEVDELRAIRAELGGGADRAVVNSAEGEASCDCVDVHGGEGDDALTSRDGASLFGDAGADSLIGQPSTAQRTADGLLGPTDDSLDGGDGDDVLVAGGGDDELAGGPGDDTARGGRGSDHVVGGDFRFPETGRAAGTDVLNGGLGDDTLDDADDVGGEIGPDALIGDRGVDTVESYSSRTAPVRIDLARVRRQGQAGEGDRLTNVEILRGGEANDTLAGDGDDNTIYPSPGADRIRGRGGDDLLYGTEARGSRVSGDVGNDLIEVQAWSRAAISCGRGRDIVRQPFRGADSERQPAEADPGTPIARNCESLSKELRGSWGIDPVPNGPPAGRTLHFDRPRGFRHNPGYVVVVTSAGNPQTEYGRANSTADGVSVQLPAAVARRARASGMTLRAEMRDDRGRLRMIWRFRVGPA